MNTLIHRWDLSPAEARLLQTELAGQVLREVAMGPVEWVAGADVHYPRKGLGRAVGVLMRYPALEPVAVEVIEEPASFPYVPGLLSFREAPSVIKVLSRLPRRPDLLLVDGQGIAHPRRFGIAAHLGLTLDIPSVGCAKSRLCGDSAVPALEAGAWTPLMDGGETIGAVLRSRTGVKPLFVSIGHRMDLPAALQWTMACCRGYRIPEPLRLAHHVAGGGVSPVASREAPRPPPSRFFASLKNDGLESLKNDR
jgi:deoxyribonuclease V